MTDLEKYSAEDLRTSMVAEIAKSINECRCALGDLEKVKARLSFTLAVLQELKDRKV
jgi:hypothetical protein